MATTAKGMYHPYAHHRGATVGSIQVTANASPTISDDPGGIASSVVKPAMTTGVYVVTLKRNYSRIHVIADTNTLLRDVKVTAVNAGGTSVNTVTVTFTDKAGAANDAAGVVATLAFYGYDS